MSQDLLTRTAEGALAGVVGTLLLQGVMAGVQQAFPQAETPESEDPASFMLWQVEKHLPRKMWMNIPPAAETAAGIALSLGYGATFGARTPPRGPRAAANGWRALRWVPHVGASATLGGSPRRNSSRLSGSRHPCKPWDRSSSISPMASPPSQPTTISAKNGKPPLSRA